MCNIWLVASHELSVNFVGFELFECCCKIFVELLVLKSLDEVLFHFTLLKVVTEGQD